MLDNPLSEPSKFRTINWVEVNDDWRGTYNTGSQIKFKTSILKSSLCNYSDAYLLGNGTKTITRAGACDAAKRLDQRKKEVIFKD